MQSNLLLECFIHLKKKDVAFAPISKLNVEFPLLMICIRFERVNAPMMGLLVCVYHTIVCLLHNYSGVSTRRPWALHTLCGACNQHNRLCIIGDTDATVITSFINVVDSCGEGIKGIASSNEAR